MKISFFTNRCIGCFACVTACIDQNDTRVGEGETPRRRVTEKTIRRDGRDATIFSSEACRHCKNAPCMAACPVGCISTCPDTQLVFYDDKKCTGCRKCSDACPFNAINFFANKIIKCDGCHFRVQAGFRPACVHACLTDALTPDD